MVELSFCKSICSKGLHSFRHISRLYAAQRLSQLIIVILIEMNCGNFSAVQSSAVITSLHKQVEKNLSNLKARGF